jgi:hypothetical protein
VTIAKFAAKLKILINNLPMSASTCLSRTDEVRFRNFHQAKIESTMGYGDQVSDADTLLPPEHHEIPNSQQPLLERGPIDAEMRYFIVMKTFHLGISRLSFRLFQTSARMKTRRCPRMSLIPVF